VTGTRNVTNINFGPCDVSYDGNWLGLSQDEVTVEFETYVLDVNTDQYGPNLPVVSFHQGESIMVTVNMLETSIDHLVETGVFQTGTNSPADRLTFGREAGGRMQGKRLVCDPTDASDIPLVVYAAIPVGKPTWSYGLNSAKVLNIQFRGLPDLSRANGDLLFRIGGGAS
jgi:hypothetical protein